MAENQLLPFANGDTANVIPFADWNSLAARLTGFQSGIASSQQFNYILAQGGSAGYVIGQLVADYTSETATIAATPLYQAFKQAIAAFVPGNIADGSIGTTKIANGSITNAKLANDAVTSAKLADNSVGTDHIQSNAVTADEIAAGAVGNSELANGAVTFPKINSAAIATQQQAEAGTATNVLMTPQRVKQAIDSAFESDLPMASATQLGGVKVTGDDGITINKAGEIAVDFSQMPTDKFEDLLKSIRVPIWLTKNTNFYVNSATGNDSNDGLTPETAFKTIQACYNNICDNYNLSSYSVVINVADGTYTEVLNLGSYASTTGTITITGSTKANFILNADSKRTNYIANTTLASGKILYIRNITINLNAQTIDTASGNDLNIFLINSGSVVLDNVTVNYYARNDNTIAQTIFYVSSEGNLSILPGNFSINMVKASDESGKSTLRGAYITGRLTLGNASNQAPLENSITVSGDFTEFIRVNGGYVYRNTTRPAQFATSGTVTGQRYIVRNGGGIATNGGGPDFFPGDKAGSIDTSTYCWYS